MGNQSSASREDRIYARLLHPLSAKASLAAHRFPPASFDPPSGFLRLATIEVQLIMQCLVGTALLRVARCNRSLLRLADSPMAWRCAVRIDSLQWWPELTLATRLICHSRLTVQWQSIPALSAGVSAARLSAEPGRHSLERLHSTLIRLPRLFELDLSECSWTLPEWHALLVLQHPSILGLQSLRLCGCDTAATLQINSDTFSLMERMPCLTSVAFRSPDTIRVRSFLATMKDRLTSVEVNQSRQRVADDLEVDVTSALLDCTSLKCLHLVRPPWNGVNFKRTFLGSPVLLRLQRLDLDDWRGPTGNFGSRLFPLSVAHWSAVLAAMTHLTHLGLHQVGRCELLFPYLGHAAALTQLDVTMRGAAPVVVCSYCPAAAVLELLRSLPSLRVRVAFRCNRAPARWGQTANDAEFFPLLAQYRTIVAEDSFQGRFTVVSS